MVAYASQGTPPSSPAAVASVFSRVIGAAAQAQKQPPGSPLGIAAVLLQGAQGSLFFHSQNQAATGVSLAAGDDARDPLPEKTVGFFTRFFSSLHRESFAVDKYSSKFSGNLPNDLV